MSAILLAAVLAAPSVTAAPESTEELRALEQVVADDAARCRRWYLGWLAGFALSSVGELVYARDFADEGHRIDARVGAFMSGLGFVSTAVLPPPQVFYDRPSRIDAALLHERLEDAADAEKLGRSWLPYVLGVAANGAAGAYLAFHHDRKVSGLLQLAVGSGVSILKIQLLPTTALDKRNASASASITPLIGTNFVGVGYAMTL